MHQIQPKFILTGGCILAFGASFTNVGFLIQTGVSVGNMTGDISGMAADLALSESAYTPHVGLIASAFVGFFLGAATSGLLVHHPQLEIEKPYGRLISSIGLLFLLAYVMLQYSELIPIGLGGFACGMQNALATKYRGLVLRTTHVTGLLTDLGVIVGMKLRGHQLETWRIWVPLSLTLSFFAGALICVVGVLQFDFPWLLIAGCSYIAGGMSWSLIKRLVVLKRID